jgi:hypothetical protein
MPLILHDTDCLLWIIDPSISPFINNKNNRRNILSEEALKNPISLLNKIKRRCFYNSALRHKIVEKIEEYKKSGLPRLYTINDKLSEKIEYMDPPFTEEECRRWVANHLVNPRTNETIKIGSNVFIELIYSAIQYGLPFPSISDTPSISKFEELAHNRMNKIMQDVKFRLEFMKENDELFINHNTVSFDRELPVATSASKAMNSFNVSSSSLSSSYKKLNESQKIRLRDRKLEDKEEEKLVSEHLNKKGFVIKKEKEKKVYKADKNVFDNFKGFIIDLEDELNNNEFINDILEDVDEHYKTSILETIKTFITPKPPPILPSSFIQRILEEHHLDTIEGVIRNFINNIYAQLIDPAFVFDRYIEISVLSYKYLYKEYRNNKLIANIIIQLNDFVYRYSSVLEDIVIKYFKNIIEDKIPIDFVSKSKIIRNRLSRVSYGVDYQYQNLYYKCLRNFNIKEIEHSPIIRLPEGMGLLIGKQLIIAFSNEIFFSNPEDRVITDDNPMNGFTYEECKKWVILPIINPRTFEQILIDTPIYNTLLVMSYQYDTNLIPRMITLRGYNIINALRDVIQKILKEKGQHSQSREQLENYIIKTEEEYKRAKELRELASKAQIPNIVGLKWKMVGTKKPTTGIEIIDKKLKAAFLKSTDKDGVPPFYVLFSEQDFANFGITDITKDSYIEMATYYIPAIHTRKGTTNNVGARWKRINDEKWKQDIQKGSEQIKNRGLKSAFLRTTGQGSKLPGHVLFSKDEFAKLGITKANAKNIYIKFAYYYKPVVTNSEQSKKSNSQIVKSRIVRKANHVVKNHYTIIDCLKWVMRPNINPITNKFIFTDDTEYNEIFEQALIFDNHIEPIDITSKGLKFKNKILEIQKPLIGISKFKKKPDDDVSTAERYDIITKSEICDIINNIYVDDDNDTKYIYFKNKMLKICDKYLSTKRVCNLPNIKNKINDKFVKINKNVPTNFNYFEISALCSVIMDDDRREKKLKIYDNNVQKKFINHYTRIFQIFTYEIVKKDDGILQAIRKTPVDAGGVSREFFTKLFEELFCDEENKKRPFILPEKNNGSNRYYINPNFEPDEHFKTVVKYHNDNNDGKPSIESANIVIIGNYTTEKEYERIYYIIGKFLGIALVNEEIGLPKQFSTYILSRFINPQKNINYYDILYYYLKDFNNSRAYINMMNEQQKNNIDSCGFSFNDYYIITKASQSNPGGHLLTKESYPKYMLQLAKHVVTKNFLFDGVEGSDKNMKKRYESLFSGFNKELSAILYNNNMSIDMLNKLITNEQLNLEILIEFAKNLKISVIKYVGRHDIHNPNAGVTKTEEEKQAIIEELRIYLTNIITKKREMTTYEEHYNFIKKLLQFWSGFSHYNKLAEVEENGYKFFYMYGGDARMFPMAHTCSYQLDFFGFPQDKTTAEDKETYLYEKLKYSVFNTKGMDNA